MVFFWPQALSEVHFRIPAIICSIVRLDAVEEASDIYKTPWTRALLTSKYPPPSMKIAGFDPDCLFLLPLEHINIITIRLTI